MTRHFMFALASIGLAAFLFMSPTAMADDNDKRTISIMATGRIQVEPDVASIRAGVMTQDKTARAALDQNSSAMNKLIEAVRAEGVAEKDIQTDRFDIQIVYDNKKNGPPTVSGYRVSNEVTVTVRDVQKLGSLIDKTVTSGANRLNSIRFDVSDYETRIDAARKVAIENATRRAKLYAEAAGVQLGEILAISENTGTSGGPPEVRTMGRMASSPAPVAPGQVDLDATVHVVWALK